MEDMITPQWAERNRKAIQTMKKYQSHPMLYQDCKEPIGEINKYYVPPEVLEGYTILNFDKGDELVGIGYKYMTHTRYNIC